MKAKKENKLGSTTDGEGNDLNGKTDLKFLKNGFFIFLLSLFRIRHVFEWRS